LFFSCKKEYITENNYYQNPQDSTVLITSPKDSSIVYDTVPILFYANKKLNIIRTECYLDFTLLTVFDNVPSKINFYANNYVMGSIHNYNLRIITKDGNAYNSNIVTLIISKLSKPVIGVTFLTKTSLKISWPDNSNDEKGYYVYRKEGTNDSVLVGNLPPNSTSFTDNTIDTTKTYTYRVEVYSNIEKLISDPLTVQFILYKYMPYKTYTVDAAVDGHIAMTPDGRRAVVTNYNNDNFTVIDLTNGSKTYLSFPGGSFGIAMSHSGSFFVTGGMNRNPDIIKVWDLSTLTPLGGITPDGEPFAMALDKTDNVLAVGGEPVETYNLLNYTLTKNFNTGSSFTRSIVFSGDGTVLLSGGNDNLVQLWNESSGALIRTFTGHTGHVGSVCFNPDESQIYSGSYEDGTVKIWDKNSGQLIKSISESSGIASINLRSDGDLIVSTLNGTLITMTPDGQTIQEFGGSAQLFHSDYNSLQDMISAYTNGAINLFKRIGHWEKL